MPKIEPLLIPALNRNRKSPLTERLNGKMLELIRDLAKTRKEDCGDDVYEFDCFREASRPKK